MILLIIKCLSSDSVLIFYIRNCTVYAQFYLIVGTTFGTILSGKNEESVVKDFFPLNERYVVSFLIILFISRELFMSVNIFSGDDITALTLTIAAVVFLALGLLQILFISTNVL